MLTSIVIHGITIPIGKGGFHVARTTSLGLKLGSRSNTRTQGGDKDASNDNSGGGNGNGSKGSDQLPAEPRPLVLGSEAQRREAAEALESKRRGENGQGQTVKFEDETRGDSERADRQTGQEGDGEPSRTATPTSSPSSGSGAGRDRSDTAGGADENGNDDRAEEGNGHGTGARRDDDRETSEQMWRGEVWQEGHDLVIESEDGERVRVEKGAKKARWRPARNG